MAELYTNGGATQYHTEGYGEAIVLPEINAEHFEIKTNLLQLVQANLFYGQLTQVDTFYNGLNENEQDSLNAAAGGNLLSKTTREALNIIENKSKVRYSRNRSNASRMNATSSKKRDLEAAFEYPVRGITYGYPWPVSGWYCGLANRKVTLRVSMAWAKGITTGNLLEDKEVRRSSKCDRRHCMRSLSPRVFMFLAFELFAI
ncbi:hypothetical protein Tco_1437671 [Tanacetum coccineum]